jgi:hypothetical protein
MTRRVAMCTDHQVMVVVVMMMMMIIIIIIIVIIVIIIIIMWARERIRYSTSAWAALSGDRIPVGGDIFRTCPGRPWDPPSLPYSGHRVYFPDVKRPGRGIDHPPTPSSAEVK